MIFTLYVRFVKHRLGFNQFFRLSTMSGQKISVPSENSKGPIPAVQFNDPKNQPMGVIVLQEWWGLNQQIQDTAQELANRGNFTTIVPDLYRGEVATDNEHAGHLMSSLDWQGAVQDIRGCAQHLKKQGCAKVGVIGFCMGGALSLASAALVTEVSASAPFYGIPNKELADPSSIKIPVQCHFGEQDVLEGFSAPADQDKLKESLKAGGVQFEFFSYPAGHAFVNSKGDNYKKEVAELALGRAVDFFKKNLA
ncbi:putative carboxymethylenebutenolidase [Patella vulgata]|uniref:putative carboxymethylenebutenolidase n=1 Tax=Patella vulgata TaxID=6465 RepID=UPI00217FCEFF|nr:putative carboxymethylenebutenolidase [Patella vulgata]